MARKSNKTAALFLCIAAIAAASGYALFQSGFNVKESTFIYIDADDDIDSVHNKISAVASPTGKVGLKAFSKLMSLDKNMRTGRYEVTPDLTMLKLVRHIRNHNETPTRIVVPSVRTMQDMAARLASQLMLDSATIADYLSDELNLQTLGYTHETLPALFIPNTYEVYWDISAGELINRLAKENNAFWNSERTAKLEAVSKRAGQSMDKVAVATLASIVDSETANNGEKPNIAGLYLNRLRTGMPLQSDPTVKFALQNFSLRRILHEHLTANSPFNTYINKGLPPGPICIPSISGIDAVLNFASHDYIYMCAKEDFSGTHNFASSYALHLVNAARYANALNKRGIH